METCIGAFNNNKKKTGFFFIVYKVIILIVQEKCTKYTRMYKLRFSYHFNNILYKISLLRDHYI